jgi:hypothetical protein
MSLNLVTVVIAIQGSPIDTVSQEGNYVFSPNGNLWPGTPGTLPIDPAVQQGHLTSGTASVQLVASDDFAAGVLTWDCILNIRGMPTIHAYGLIINYATGSTQSIWDILSSNGVDLVNQP